MESSSDRPHRRVGLWLKLVVVLAAIFAFFLVAEGGDVVQAAIVSAGTVAFFAGCAAAIALPYVLASRWGAFTYAEVERFPTPEQRDRALDEAVRGVTPLIAATGIMIGICAASAFLLNYFAVKEPWRTAAFFVMFFAIFWSPLPVLLLRRRRKRAILRQHLCAAGVPTCMSCGYDLRGLSGIGRCPECGAAFEIRSGTT